MPCFFRLLYLIILATFWTSSGNALSRTFLLGVTNVPWALLPRVIHGKAGLLKRDGVSSPSSFTGSSTLGLLALAQVKTTMEINFELIQDTEAGIAVQLKPIKKEDSRTLPKVERTMHLNKFSQSEGDYFEGNNGNTYFTVVIFKFKYSPYLVIRLHMKAVALFIIFNLPSHFALSHPLLMY